MSRVLFASSEAHPLIKTGGLADVAGSLPRALHALEQDVRLILPAYAECKTRAGKLKPVASLEVNGQRVSLLESRLPGTRVKTWLVDCPLFFDRPGNPYLDPDGEVWPDNAQRFALFCQVISRVSLDQAGLYWQADIVHCNDWQTGLVPALLTLAAQRPATVFTIHNLAYQGLFSYETFKSLGLPPHFWHHEALEFHHQLSFIKGGLVFADRINTVSPTYAREIQTPEFGNGLDGLLRHRKQALSGILNGIDTDEWNPGSDSHLPQKYNRRSLGKKVINKLALEKTFNLPEDAERLLIGFIGRLVEQKGVDIIIQALPELVKLPLKFVLLGSGQREYESALNKLARQHREKIGIRIGYSEQLAHQIEAGVDTFLMPSRFEPCGLNQLYSLRYGTPPIVRGVGGLADSVVDANEETLEDGSATGVVFHADSAEALLDAVQRTLSLYNDKKSWKKLQLAGMRQDFSWRQSAQRYLELYQSARKANPCPIGL